MSIVASPHLPLQCYRSWVVPYRELKGEGKQLNTRNFKLDLTLVLHLVSMKTSRFFIFTILATLSQFALSLKACFTDSYHGKVYGQNPMWQARFMVKELIENLNWAIQFPGFKQMKIKTIIRL